MKPKKRWVYNTLVKKILRLFKLSLVSGVIFIWWWHRDIELPTDLRVWLIEVESGQSAYNPTYLYLKGIDAPVGVNPAELGLARVELGFLDDLKRLPNPQRSGFFCSVLIPECISTIFSGLDAVEPVLSENQELINRYLDYLSLPDIEPMEIYTMDSILPPFEYLLTGTRLYNLQILSAHSNPQQALLEHADRLRKELRLATSLVHKMVAVNQLNETYNFLATYLFKNNIRLEQKISELNFEEASLTPEMQNELYMGIQVFNRFLDDPTTLKELGAFSKYLPTLWYKPNMTIVSAYQYYLHIAEASEMPQNQIVNALNQTVDMQYHSRNPKGNKLLKAGAPDLERYLFRLQDINLQITLINNIRYLNNGFGMAEINNPYQGEYQDKVNVNNGWGCLESPGDQYGRPGEVNRGCIFLMR